jgi:AbrB family looped-hinge helix DNA binding protein
MSIETVKMSSKGQVVIPQDIRESLHLREGSIFAVVSGEDSVVLKKVQTPSKEELIADLSRIAKEGSKRAKKLGIKESDVVDIVHRYRKSKRK